jgi:1-deoxy-D-xylulose-5-phosphate synthase
VKAGGFGSAVLEFAAAHQYQVPIQCLGIPDVFPEHGSVSELQEIAGISVEHIRRAIISQIRKL